MRDITKDAYTLLADDNLDISQNLQNLSKLKAHIVLSVLTNTSLMFSDNQIVNSANLSALLTTDDTIRELVRQKVLHFALRRQQDDILYDPHDRLLNTYEAFVKENKAKIDRSAVGRNDDFQIIAKHGVVIDWHYEKVRSNYTQLCRKTLLSDTGRKIIGDTKFALFKQLIEQEDKDNKGLGRIFVQKSLFETMEKYGLPLDGASRQFVKNATEAPYLSNLPQILARNPIYEPQHQQSFELVRNIKYDFVDIEAPKKVGNKLDTHHFTEGLTRLSADDILRLREHAAFRRYVRLCGDQSLDARNLDELQLSLIELRVSIDDRIYTKFTDLHSSNRETTMELRTKLSRASTGIGMFTDLVGLFFWVPPLFGALTGTLIDLARKRRGIDDASLRIKDIAAHQLLQSVIEKKLSENGADPYMRIEDVVTTDSHDVETVVHS